MAATSTCMLFLLLCAIASAQNQRSIIPVPSSLSLTSNPWLSPSRKFAFGFDRTSDGYTICIVYTSFSNRPVVWTAAADKFDPILPRSGILLELKSNGVELLRCDQNGIPFSLYGKIASPGEAIAWASMLDNGNFVLYNSAGGVIWQSFDYPTDTILPGQRLPPDGELVSRASKTDLSRGMFRVKMQFDGNLVQYPVGTPDMVENAYFSSHTEGAGWNVSLYLDDAGRLYLHNGIFCLLNFTSGWESGVGFFYLARVDPDGIFRVYNHRGDGNLTSMWTSMVDRCDVKGVCRVNSVCSIQDQTAVSCTCLPGFSDSSAGCSQDYDIRACRNKNSSVRYEITRMPNVTWIDNSYNVNYTTTEEDCRHACLNDCHCIAALFYNGQCHQQNFPLRYGRRSTSSSAVALVRVTLPPDASGTGNGKSHVHMYVVVIIGVSIIGIAALVIYLVKQNGFCCQDEESKENVNKFLLNHGSLAPKRYSYKQIRKITKSFTEKLGQGGYGIVYKGTLPDGLLVAVKVLRETNDNAEEFVNEVASISRTSHVNIVNLLGFCFERKKRALVYEFMPNKSLDKFIYKSGDSTNAECSLEWKKLYEIAVGVARGLEYLHRGCNTMIVHFDIKPQNILLDQYFCPKISDFGLAKLCMKQQSSISMLGTRGTIGYIAPEVFSRNFGVVSHKSDVYSYGIMLLQMVEARTNVEIMSFQPSEICFLEKIYKHVLEKNEKVYDLMTEEEEVVRRMLMVGFWCIQTAPSGRPSMDNVVDMLAGNLQSIEIPPLPFLLCSPKPQFSCSLSVIVETQSFT